MKTISILGCGWLGLPLGEYLVKRGFVVKGSTTQKEKLQELEHVGIKPYHLSFEPDLVGEARDFFDSEILIINLPPRNREGVPNFYELQLETIRSYAQGSVKHVLFVSSTGVYPNSNQEVTEEDADVNCLSRSGIPLLKMEQIFTQSTAFETTIMRFGGLYGPERHPGRFLAGKTDLLGADNPVNMIHLEDCLGVIEAIIDQGLWGETFNACSPKQETRKSFYQSAANDLGLQPPTFNDQPQPFKKVSSEKLIKLAGYKFKY
ncbi:SDR family oxidoreductase [Fulvivirga sp. RKSG066]|uniref:SDR family oxidoreductase n=1 Tax=Fulvivirga aurantia TaxID=2529383 RepID=UPI0012BD6351|nr:SDR family oxidoreductase [Fulvivirga aurantia]MTI20606.1 SDR family oxidoreductase [Fulvivirga aurantia]